MGLDLGARGGQYLPPQRVRRELDVKRDFHITDQILERYGLSADCPGCEAKLWGRARRAHTRECRNRLEEEIRRDDDDSGILRRRDERRKAKVEVSGRLQPEVPPRSESRPDAAEVPLGTERGEEEKAPPGTGQGWG